MKAHTTAGKSVLEKIENIGVAMAYKVIVFLFFICTVESSDVLFENGTLPDFALLCPFNKMCSSTPTKGIINGQPCCQKCSCASDCHVVGNCCPDVAPNNFTEPIYPCVDIRQLFNKQRGLEFRPNYDLQFHVIDTCPDKRRDDAFPACKLPVELSDFVMVSDNAGGKVFKNRKCAMCHGIHDYIVWNSYTSCREIASKTFETFEERDEYVLNKCALMSLPPDSHILEMNRCYSEKQVISECNVTGKWDVYDKEVKQACETKRLTYNTIFKPTGVIGAQASMFANIYCYLCNNAEQSRVIDLCPADEIKPGRELMMVSFSSLLNLNADLKDTTDASQCKSMDIWDTFDNICRPLLCPGGSIPHHGTCEDSSISTSGYTLSVVFSVNTSKQTEVSYKLLKFLDGELFKFAGRKFYCGKCPTKLLVDNMDGIFFELSMYTTDMCSTKQLLKFVDHLVRKRKIRLKYEDVGRLVNITLKVTFDNPEDKHLVTMFHRKMCLNIIYIDQVLLQNCPRIELSTQETKALKTEDADISDKVNRALIINKNTNDTTVCVNKYFELRKQTKNGQQSSNERSTLLLAVSVGLFSVAVFT